MSESTPHATLIPPYLDEHWRRLRVHMQTASDIACQTSSASTVEEMRSALSSAMHELMGADLQLILIERDGEAAILDAE